MVNLMNEARRVHYNQFIEDNSTDRRRLFMASKSLLNRSLPPHTDSASLGKDIFIISVRKYLSRSSSETLIHAFITSRLDYCNSLLYGLPKYQLSKLQRVMNASARLVYSAPKSCHITPLLRELHWLPVCYRIEYKTRNSVH